MKYTNNKFDKTEILKVFKIFNYFIKCFEAMIKIL